MRHYFGDRTPEGCVVEVVDSDSPMGGDLLNPRNDLRNHSPDGFCWGYNGSGPAQLALALLADALGDETKALKWYQEFKMGVVARLPEGGWELSQEEIRQAVAELVSEKGRRR